MGITYKARLRDRTSGRTEDRMAVFEKFDGHAHRVLATSRPDGFYDTWMTIDVTIGPTRVVDYDRAETCVEDFGSAYLT